MGVHLHRVVEDNMLADGLLNPIDSVRARLQEQIGNFLQGRAKLNRLMSNPSLQVQGQARGLYAVQTALETRLQDEIMPKIQKVNAGVYEWGDIITFATFTKNIIQQINEVGKLERQVGGVPSGILGDMAMSTIAVGLMLSGIILVGSGIFFGRRTL